MGRKERRIRRKCEGQRSDDQLREIIEEFVKRRNAMLEKRSVDELIRFVATDPAYDGDPIRPEFAASNRLMQEMTLCKMIEAAMSVSRETKEWARVRLGEIRELLKGA